MKTSNLILIKFYTTLRFEQLSIQRDISMKRRTATTMSFNSAINFVIIRFYYLIINFNHYKKCYANNYEK